MAASDEPKKKNWLGLFFGIFMIIVYVGMGVLMFVNYFGFDEAWTWARIVIGVLLCAYGVFRGYRLYKGIDISNNGVE